MSIIMRKYKLATLLNCSYKFFGKKVNIVYLEVLILLFSGNRSSLLFSGCPTLIVYGFLSRCFSSSSFFFLSFEGMLKICASVESGDRVCAMLVD